MQTTSRVNAILSRWRDIASYTLIGAIFSEVLAPILILSTAPLVEFLANLPAWLIGCAAASPLALAVIYLGLRRISAILGVGSGLTFPPIWIAVPCALLVAESANQCLRHTLPRLIEIREYLPYFGGLLVVWIVGNLFILLVRHNRRMGLRNIGQTAANITPQSQLGDVATLVQWIRDDREISEPHQDLFGHDLIARRIANRMRVPLDQEAPTVALIGERGSGKSTIGALTQYHLCNDAAILFARVSLWPFESAEAAVRGVLAAVIRALATRANVLSLKGLPQQYASIVERMGIWGSIAASFRTALSPQEVIEQVGRIALATNSRVVLWIEDLERFSQTATSALFDAVANEQERLGPIRALLYLLNECRNVSVIIADATLDSRFDLDKIARFVENVPPLDVDAAWVPVEALRRQCLDVYPCQVIDPVDRELRSKFAPKNPFVRSAVRYMQDDRVPDPPEAMNEILRTPRSLKNALRMTHETWLTMPGEVDFDHVLLASSLRCACPDVIAFINDNIHEFRRGFQKTGRQQDPTQSKAYRQFESILEASDVIRSADAIRSIVRAIFPALPEHNVIPDIDRQYVERPQGLFVERHTDYWNRYLSGAEIPESESDQEALRSIRRWKNRESNDLLERVISKDKHEQVETFVVQLRPNDLLRLLEEVVHREMQEGVESWSELNSPTGGVSVWRMMLRRNVASRQLRTTLEPFLGELTKTHLPYVQFLFHYFCSPTTSANVHPLTDGEDTKAIARFISESLRTAVVMGSESSFRESFRGAHPFMFFWLLREIGNHTERNGNGFPISGWTEISEGLLRAAEKDPAWGIPILLPFFVQLGDRIVHRHDAETEEYLGPTQVATGQFDSKAANKLFDSSRLGSLITKTPIPENIDKTLRVAWEAARSGLEGNEANSGAE